jgi:hypothetical protein
MGNGVPKILCRLHALESALCGKEVQQYLPPLKSLRSFSRTENIPTLSVSNAIFFGGENGNMDTFLALTRTG